MLSWIPKSKCNGTTAMENTVFCRSDVWGYLGILVRYKGVSLGNAYRRQSARGLFSHCCGTLEGTGSSRQTSTVMRYVNRTAIAQGTPTILHWYRTRGHRQFCLPIGPFSRARFAPPRQVGTYCAGVYLTAGFRRSSLQ
jgi:hypothetical protein